MSPATTRVPWWWVLLGCGLGVVAGAVGTRLLLPGESRATLAEEISSRYTDPELPLRIQKLSQSGRHTAALAAARSYLGLTCDAGSWDTLVFAATQAGEVEDAFQAGRGGLESIRMQEYQLLFGILRLYEREGRLDEAENLLEEVRPTLTDDVFIYMRSGIMAAKGDIDEARRAIAALSSNPFWDDLKMASHPLNTRGHHFAYIEGWPSKYCRPHR